MSTNPATRVRIAAMCAAETAIERNPRDPFVELERFSVASAGALAADPETVFEVADEIVIETLTSKLLTEVS